MSSGLVRFLLARHLAEPLSSLHCQHLLDTGEEETLQYCGARRRDIEQI